MLMAYLAAGAVLIWIAARVYRRSPGVQRGRWRVGSGLLASALLAAAGFTALRGAYGTAAALGVAALVLAGMTRSDRSLPARSKPAGIDLSTAQARDILGVGPSASGEEIQAAYTRLMRLAHPDRGGTTGLAAQLNAARDMLLK